MARQNQGRSIRWVVLAVFALVTYVSWGVLAASYAEGMKAAPRLSAEDPQQRGRMGRVRGARFAIKFGVAGLATFVGQSIAMLPRLPWVFAWHVSHRPALLGFLGSVQASVLAGGLILRAMERRLEKPLKVKRRHIPVPQFRDED